MIKKCKFCGNADVRVVFNDENWGRITYSVQCMDCGASTLTYISEEIAIEMWNGRAD